MLSDYLTIEIAVGAWTPQGYPMTIRSPGGDDRGMLVLPTGDPAYDDLAARLAQFSVNATEMATLGQILFRALFQGSLKDTYVRSQGALGAGQGLRLRLDIDPREAEVAALPWEFINDPDRGPLALREAPIMRYLSHQGALPRLKVEPPLRVLLTAAHTPPPAPVEAELEAVRAALAGLGTMVELTVEPHLTSAKLQDLLRQDFHVWHFVGHGGKNAAGVGLLLLEDELGDPAPLMAPELGTMLTGSSVRLAVINACGGASQAGDPQRGIAPALVVAGVPAVVAMQFAVAAESARVFATELYQALTEGFPLDACVTEGRKAVLAAVGANQPDWGVPVVYSRAADTRLFDLPPAPKPRCPYPGMVPFQPQDARFFFGRETEIGQILQHLRTQNRLLIIGPSGSGKSSLVKAGVLPRLRESTLFAPGTWVVRELRPGDRPAERLAAALGADPTMPIVQVFDRAPHLVADLLARTAPEDRPAHDAPVAAPAERRLLLLIDQFEELFTLADRAEQLRFVAAFQALRFVPQCTLLLAMRADFFPDLMSSALWPIDPSQRIEIAPLRGASLRAAIERPAQAVGVRIEAGLVDRLLSDAADEPGVLPLIQETLVLLWDRMPHRLLSLRQYDELGGEEQNALGVAIATRADATLASLDEAQQAIARRVLLRLVQFGEGRADTRRQQPRDALRVPGDDPQQFDTVLKALVDNRLLTVSSETSRRQQPSDGTDAGMNDPASPLVDISHEALIRNWPALRDWVRQRRAAERTRRRLEEKAAEWRRLGGEQGGMLDDVELAEAERWLASSDAADLGVSSDLQALVAASKDALETARRLEEEARQRELKQARELAATRTREARRTRRMAVVIFGVAVVAMIAAIAAGLLYGTAQRNEAEAQRRLRRAVAGELAAEAQLALEITPQRALLLAMLAQRALEPGDGPVVAAEQVLRDSLDALGGRPFDPTGQSSGIFAGPGRRLATIDRNGTVRVWDSADLAATPLVLPNAVGRGMYPASALKFTSDGNHLIAIREDTARIYDLTAPDPAASAITVPFPINAITDLQVSAGARRMVETIASSDGGSSVQPSTRVWNVRDGQVTLAFELPGISETQLSDDGRWLLAPDAAQTRAILRDLEATDPAASARVLASLDDMYRPAFSPDSRWLLLTAGVEEASALWDLRADPPVEYSIEGVFNFLAFAPDSSIALTTDGSTVYVWDLQTGRPDGNSWQLEDAGIAVAFNPDKRLLVTARDTVNIQLWQLDRPGNNGRIEPYRSFVAAEFPYSAIFASDGSWLATQGIDFPIQLWDLTHGPETPHLSLKGHDGGITGIAVSADDRTLFTSSLDGTVRVWDVRRLLARGLSEKTIPYALSNDGRRILARNDEDSISTMLVVDVNDPSNTVELPDADWQISVAAFSARRLVLVGEGGNASLWRLDGNQAQETRLPFKITPDVAAAATSDVRLMAITSGKSVEIWDLAVEPPARVQTLELPAPGDALQFYNGDRSLAVAGRRADDRYEVRLFPSLDGADVTVIPLPDTIGLPLVVSDDSALLAAGPSNSEGPGTVWRLADLRRDVEQARPLMYLRGNDGAFDSLRFNPQIPTMVLASNEKRDVRRWLITPQGENRAVLLRGAHVPIIFDATGKDLLGYDVEARVRTIPLDEARLEEQACAIVGRNMTLAESQEVSNADVYKPTCDNLPPHQSYIDSLISTALSKAHRGDITGALNGFDEARQRDPAAAIDESAWRELCRVGALDGKARDVLPACGAAVAIAPSHGPARSARGIARALTGDPQGAIDDFAFFVAWARIRPGQGYDEQIARHEAWIAALRAGNNPFDGATLRLLRQ